MPIYTTYANLYLPNATDDIDVATSLADNFQKIDDKLEEIGEAPSPKTFLSVKDYNAIGDGFTNDATAFQNAINAVSTRGGGTVFVPYGNYVLGSTLTLPSNVTILGEGYGSRLLSTSTTDAFQAIGSLGTERNFGSSVTLGGNSFTTTTSHGLAVGDVVLLKSQRNALSSADSGNDWTLGYGTPSVPNAFFGEFKNVQTVTSTTAFTTDSGVIYPSYANNQTNDPNGRATSTVFKFNPAKNIRIEKISLVSGGNAFKFENCMNCQVVDVDVEMTGDGAGIHFDRSYKCEGIRANFKYTSTSAPAQIYSRNCLKITGSQEVGFTGCSVDKGSQSVDISFYNNDIVSTHCFYRDNIITNATKTGMTTHGGNYGTIITGNIVTNCLEDGIMARGRQTIISGNRVQGTMGNTNGEGIYLYEGWARDCVISNNTVAGFGRGIGIRDGADAGERFGYVGCTIIGNTITEFLYGIYLERSVNNKDIISSGILISNNVFRNPRGSGSGIEIGPYVNHFSILGNHIYLDSTQDRGINIVSNGGGGVIRDNVIYQSTSLGIVHAGFSDSTTWSTAPTLFATDNIPIGFASNYSLPTTITVNRRVQATTAPCEYYFTTAGAPAFQTNGGSLRNISFTT